MIKKNNKISKKCCNHHWHECKGTGAVYGLGFVGSAIYFISTATGFWNGVLGFLKAIVWPVFFVYGGFKFLGI